MQMMATPPTTEPRLELELELGLGFTAEAVVHFSYFFSFLVVRVFAN